jgi:phosphatidylethanolamine/phosphatidyl-N-methylethanolamine N-methyltransferase
MPLDRAEAVAEPKVSNLGAAWLFFKKWMANPLGMASITPSAPALSRMIAAHVRREPDEVVVEYGGGTGPITRALLEAGVPASRLFVCELDPELATYLRTQFPDVNVLEGDVRNIRQMLPPQHIGKVGTVVVGIPMILLPAQMQQEVVDGIFQIMPPDRRFLAYTYSTGSPMKADQLGLTGKRLGFTLANIPPASVWGYAKKA